MEARLLTELTLHEFFKWFPEPSEEEIGRTVQELKVSGQTQPVEIASDTVISGQVILLAARKIGLQKVKVISREDYRGMNQALLGLHILDGHFDRTKSDLFELAELYDLWLVWKDQFPRRRLNHDRRKAMNKQIAEMFKKIGPCDQRTVERHRDALGLPPPILHAVRGGLLSLCVCPRLRRLPRERQNAIADLVHQGISPKEAVARFLPPEKVVAKHPKTAMRAIIRAGQRCVASFEESPKSIGILDDDEIDILKRLDKVVQAAVKNNGAARKLAAKQAAALQEVIDLIQKDRAETFG